MAKKNSGGGCGALLLLGVAAFGVAGAGQGGETTSSGAIPGDYLAAYQAAAGECPTLDWELLAAVGYVESRHGQSSLPGVDSGANGAGAAGPMQFMPATWAAYGSGSVYDIDNAAPAAATYLCDSGLAEGDADAAIYAYNHSHAYVRTVRARADAYRG